jgi:hypothetical protein
MIKRLLLSALIAAVSPAVLLADDKQAAQDLLKAAAQQVSLLEDSNKPFVMDVDFTAKIDQPMQGHLRLRWESKDRWWSKVTMGPFEQIKLQNGDRSYTLTNAGFTPLLVTYLFDLLRVEKDLDKLSAKKYKEHAENVAPVHCVEAQLPGFEQNHFEVCVNESSHIIVSRTSKDRAGLVQVSKFDDWSEFGGKAYPRRLQFDQNGTTLLTANVMDLKESQLDPQLLVAPAGAIERRECPGKKMPSMISHPDPTFIGLKIPSRASDTMSVTVLADGSVGEVHVLESGGKTMDDEVIRSISKAKFKPGMCGSEPVVVDIRIKTDYLRN